MGFLQKFYQLYIFIKTTQSGKGGIEISALSALFN